MLTLGAMQGNIIRTTLFPGIASDRVTVRLQMPQGTNERITDSIISMVEQKAYIIGERFDKKQKGDKKVIQNVLKRIGPGTSNASININLLPGEERNFSSREISNALRDEVGAVYGVEQLTFNSGGNFGGKPVSYPFK